MNYCSNCGHRVITKIPEGDTLSRYACPNCGMVHYENPNLIVGTIPIKDGHVLLCRRAIEPRMGMWTIPSGFLENGETVEAGALRETREETGADVELIRLHTVYSCPHISQVYMLFLSEVRSRNSDFGTETSETRLFANHEIPWDEIAFSAVRFALETYLKSEKNGNKDVHFGVREGRKQIEELPHSAEPGEMGGANDNERKSQPDE